MVGHQKPENVTDGQVSGVGLGGSYHIRNDSVGLCWAVEVGRLVRIEELEESVVNSEKVNFSVRLFIS